MNEKNTAKEFENILRELDELENIINDLFEKYKNSEAFRLKVEEEKRIVESMMTSADYLKQE